MLICEHAWTTTGKADVHLRKMFAGYDTLMSCDPDANGAMVLWSGGAFLDARSLTDAGALRWLQGNVRARYEDQPGRILAVVETQYGGRNIAATIAMARRAGYVIGALSLCAPIGVELVTVVPSTWQFWTVRRTGRELPKQAGGRRRELLADAVFDAWNKSCVDQVPGWDGLNTKAREGMRSAYGIGRWWIEEVACAR